MTVTTLLSEAPNRTTPDGRLPAPASVQPKLQASAGAFNPASSQGAAGSCPEDCHYCSGPETD